MRVCHLNTCPVGVATQDPSSGRPHRQARVHRALLPVHRRGSARAAHWLQTMDDDRACRALNSPAVDHWKAKGLDYSAILYEPDAAWRAAPLGDGAESRPRRGARQRADRAVPQRLEQRVHAIEVADSQRAPHRRHDARLRGHAPHGGEGLPDDSSRSRSPGRPARAGAFVPRGITLELEGDSNDYVGKAVRRPDHRLSAEAGDVRARGQHHHRQRRAHGATSGEATSAASPASGLRCATAARSPWSKASAITAASI